MPDELSELRRRYELAKEVASKNGAAAEFQSFESLLRTDARVVVSTSVEIAHSIVTNARILFANYEALIDGEARTPALPHFDKERRGVGGILFGTYADRIRYGVISLTNVGLPTYGDVYFSLRAVAVADRVSLLERNSYAFVEDHKLLNST